MALRLSTELRQQLMGDAITVTGITYAAVAATQKITDTGKGLLTDGFRPGMIVKISGFTTGANNIYGSITSVASDGSDMVIAPSAVDALENEVAGDSVTITAIAQSFKEIFEYGVLCIYTGNQPADADTAPSGTKLLEITVDAGALTKGTKTNGLQWDDPSAGVIGKNGDAWQDAALATGTAGWFRFYANDFDTGADALCFDGTVGTSGAQLNLSSVAIVLAATTTIDEFEVTLPANA